MLQNDYQFMSLREMRLIAGVPIAEPSRITGEGSGTTGVERTKRENTL